MNAIDYRHWQMTYIRCTRISLYGRWKENMLRCGKMSYQGSEKSAAGTFSVNSTKMKVKKKIVCDCALTKHLFVRWRLSLHIYPFIHSIAACTVSTQTYTLAVDEHTYGWIHRHRHAQTCWRIPLKTLAYIHTRPELPRSFQITHLIPLSLPPQHEWRRVCVCVCVCMCVYAIGTVCLSG